MLGEPGALDETVVGGVVMILSKTLPPVPCFVKVEQFDWLGFRKKSVVRIEFLAPNREAVG